MPIYLLRHEERDQHNTSFETPLTWNGQRRAATDVADRLKEVNAVHVFSSPYVRCVQTVLPFCWAHNVPLHIEPALFEHDSNGIQTHPPMALTPRELSIIGGNYSAAPFVSTADLATEPFADRIDGYRRYITKLYERSAATIVLCTHLCCINALLQRDLNHPLDMGGLIKLQD